MDTTLSAPIGQLLDGRYLVESQIARGGMATVYHARDVRLERTVALKIAHPEFARDPEFAERFITEARAAARLSSPNVVAVFDQGATGDLNYIAMEYVPGPTLRELLVARGRLNPREALDIIERVLAGLAAAHDAGIIHRDVKPENVLLGNGSSVKVTDFGLARAASGMRNTRTGLLIGTAAYLAPEQVANNTSDKRSDVYAAGVMLFELLTGVQPHTGETPLAVAYKHVNHVVPAPSSVNPDLPPVLDALVALGTSRDPDLRPPDARAYLKAISEVRRGMPLTAAWRDGQVDGGMDGSYRPADGPAAADSGLPGAGLAGAGLAGAGLAGAGLAGAGLGGLGFTGQRGADVPSAGPGVTGPLPIPAGPTGAFPTEDYLGRRGSGQAANHTMIVPADSMGDEYADTGGYPARRQRHTRRHTEPWLQRWLFSRRILIVLAVLVLVIVGWWVTDGQYSSVPSVVGMNVSTARDELTGAGFAVVSGTARHSYSVPKGDVISISPAAGTRVSHGGKITIIASLGPIEVMVPQVSGQPVQQAEQQLRSVGLTPGAITYETSSSLTPGLVISTTPAADQLWPKDKPVAMVVSKGPPLPNLVGQQISAAQAAAQQGGYTLNVQQAPSNSTQPAGTIVSQSPAAGSPVSPNEVVTVYVSQGQGEVAVPDVTGLNVNQAEQELQAAGFNVSVTTLGPGSKVITYSPQGQAPQGSTITIAVGFSF